jgi:hypothetical protein
MKKILAVSAVALSVGFAGAANAEQWNMQSTYPGSLTQLGTLGKHVAAQVLLCRRLKCSMRLPPAP